MHKKIGMFALGLVGFMSVTACQEISGLFDENRDSYSYDSTHKASNNSYAVDMQPNKAKPRKIASSTPEVSAPKATAVTTTAPRKGNGVPLSGPVVPQTAPAVGE